MAAFLALISILRRGAAGFDTLCGDSFCLPLTSSTVPVYAGAGTPSNPDFVVVGMACARLIAVMDRNEVAIYVDRDEDAMGANSPMVGAACRREAVNIAMIPISLMMYICGMKVVVVVVVYSVCRMLRTSPIRNLANAVGVVAILRLNTGSI
jgi:hypothetical protein